MTVPNVPKVPKRNDSEGWKCSESSGVSKTPELRNPSGGTEGQELAALQQAFDGTVLVSWSRGQGQTGKRPDFLSWPMVRGDEFGPPIETQADLAKASKGKR
jgi:hypothetical protein